MRILSLLLLTALVGGCTDEPGETLDATVMDANPGIPDGSDMGPMGDAAVDMIVDSGTSDASAPTIQVGYRETSLTYTPRGAAEARTVSLSIWYPTVETEGDFTAYQAIFVRDEVYMNAAPSFDGPAPVLLFSHGRCGFSQYSFFLTEYFARAGWLVAGVDHAGDVLLTCGNTAELFEQRPQDVSAMLDHLQGLPADDPLAGIASDDVALVGHSYGGYTGLVVAGARFAMDYLEAECEPEAESGLCSGFPENADRLREGFHDPRIKVLVPIAAGDYNVLREGIAQIDVPTLFMTASSDLNNPNEVDGDPIWAQLREKPANRRVRFDRAGHFSFTSICNIIGPLGDDNGCSEGMIAPEDLHPIVNQYVMAFLRLHLFGDESGRGLIDGEISLRDEVTLVRPEGSP